MIKLQLIFICVYVWSYSTRVPICHAFTQLAITTTITKTRCHHASSCLYMNGAEKFKREIEERSLRRASERGGPGGSMAAGAILGGLVAGPFGALFGANIGANLGVKSSLDKARKEEMERMGITQEMLDAAEDVGQALQQSMQGMDATKESLSTQQALARRIDQEATDLYERAKEAMAAGDEEKARILLLRRTNTQDKLKIVLKGCADEKKRLEIMGQNVTVLQQRALEVEAMLSRTVGAKARQDSASTVNDFEIFSVRDNDPLLQKFKDLGID